MFNGSQNILHILLIPFVMSYSYLVVSDFIYCSIFRFELVFFYTGFEDRVIRNLKKVDNNCGRYGTKCWMWFY